MQAPKVPDHNIDKMVKKLKDRDEKLNLTSRRRKFREEKDTDSIYDWNEHFSKKIERRISTSIRRSNNTHLRSRTILREELLYQTKVLLIIKKKA